MSLLSSSEVKKEKLTSRVKKKKNASGRDERRCLFRMKLGKHAEQAQGSQQEGTRQAVGQVAQLARKLCVLP